MTTVLKGLIVLVVIVAVVWFFYWFIRMDIAACSRPHDVRLIGKTVVCVPKR